LVGLKADFVAVAANDARRGGKETNGVVAAGADEGVGGAIARPAAENLVAQAATNDRSGTARVNQVARAAADGPLGAAACCVGCPLPVVLPL